MEEKNTVLMQTNVGLEEDLRKANAAKGQLETYKRQVPTNGRVDFQMQRPLITQPHPNPRIHFSH